MARRLYAVTPASIQAMEHRMVPSASAAQQVARLRAAGLTWAQIADYAGLSVFATRQLGAEGATCPALSSLRLAAAAEAHGLYYHESSYAAA